MQFVRYMGMCIVLMITLFMSVTSDLEHTFLMYDHQYMTFQLRCLTSLCTGICTLTTYLDSVLMARAQLKSIGIYPQTFGYCPYKCLNVQRCLDWCMSIKMCLDVHRCIIIVHAHLDMSGCYLIIQRGNCRSQDVQKGV